MRTKGCTQRALSPDFVKFGHWGSPRVTLGTALCHWCCAGLPGPGDEPGFASSHPERGQMQICTNKERCVAKTVKYTRTNTGKCELFMKNVLEVP